MCLERQDLISHQMKFQIYPKSADFSEQSCAFRISLSQQDEEWSAGQGKDEDNRMRLEALALP